MSYQPLPFAEKKDMIALLHASEAAYRASVDAAITAIRARPSLRFLALSGPTCSGKTTTASRMMHDLGKDGHRVALISIDDFFYDREILHRMARESGKPLDLDSVKTIDLPRLSTVVDDLLACRPTSLPRFDFSEGRRVAEEPFLPTEKDLYLFEGIQALYPEVVALFEPSRLLRLFIEVEMPTPTPHGSLSPRECRLLRRLLRDSKFRGTDAATTFAHWEQVVENERKNIEPYRHTAEVHIDSSLPYEMAVMKEPLLAVLSAVPKTDPAKEKAEEYMALLSTFPTVDASYVPKDSVLREFIGF